MSGIEHFSGRLFSIQSYPLGLDLIVIDGPWCYWLILFSWPYRLH